MPLTSTEADYANPELLCRKVAKSCELTHTGRNVLLVAGFSDDPAQNSPMLRILRV